MSGWVEAADALVDQIAYARSVPGRRYYARESQTYRGAGAHDAESTLIDSLRSCDPIYVGDEVCELVEAAREGFRAASVDSLFVREGFALFARPFVLRLSDEHERVIEAIAWTQVADGIVVGSFGPSRGDGVKKLLSHFVLPTNEDLLKLASYESTRLLCDRCLILWRLATQVLDVRAEVPPRAARRRASRLGREIKTVVVVALRRRATRRDSEKPVEWTHRWVVRGHWRNQWYPKTQAHHQVWIDPYLKGPEERPLVRKARAWEFVR